MTASHPSTNELNTQRRFALMLYRSLQRLHIAIKDCAKIGFEESSPTRNAHHYDVWMALNNAQADAALKIKAYEDHSNAILAEKIRNDPDDEPSAGGGPPA